MPEGPDPQWETVKVEVANNLATVTLNRPDRMNAISLGLLRDGRGVLKALLHRDDVRAVLIKGAGQGFCSGVDLTAPKPGVDPNDPDEMLRDYHLPFFQLLREFPKPTVAAVHGPCIGAGLSLALGCDIVVAARSAYFLAAFINIGLAPDTGASWLLQRAVGDVRARGMLMLGERVAAPQAFDWGMIWKCVEDDALEAEAGAIAQKLADGPLVAHRQLKKLMRNVTGASWRDHVLAEADAQSIARASADAREARAAFREKRKPLFTGE